MKSLEVLGAGSGEVTGSHNLLTLNSGSQILVDCGIYQGVDRGPQEVENVQDYDSKDLEAIVVTHGHLDHIGGLPRFAEKINFKKIPIYMTPATSELVDIQYDVASGLDPNKFPYKGIRWVQKNIQRLPYGKKMKVDGASVSFEDAGHIIGSASAIIEECRGETVVFSGDLGNYPSRTVAPTRPPDDASVVVLESTYGDKVHSTEDPKDQIGDAISIIEKKKKGGTILIPSFAIDRTQMILRILKEMRRSGDLKNSIPVFLDSPMATRVTELYEKNKHLLNEELQEDCNPFRFTNLKIIEDSKRSRQIKNHHGPKIIIAGSGMMSGGRIENHAIDFLPEKDTVILFVGYPAKGTPSRKIAVEEVDEVQIRDRRVEVNSHVRRVGGLSAHADQNQLQEWLDHVNGGQTPIRKVILNHGENPQREAFAEKVLERKIEVVLPENGDVIDLSVN